MIRPTGYEVLITPLVAPNTYGSTLSVDRDINLDGLTLSVGDIKESLDDGDFDVGILSFSSINMTCINLKGRLSGPEDHRSIFKFTRDKARIEIKYYNGIDENPTSTFIGIIDERASRENLITGELKLKILSLTSILNRFNVPFALLRPRIKIGQAIRTILELPQVASTLSLTSDSIMIEDEDDHVIDNPAPLWNISVRQSLTNLLLSANLTMITKKATNEVVIRTRNYSTGNTINLFGPYSLYNEQNIVSVKKYNSGLHRVFNGVKINDHFYQDSISVNLYGNNNKEFNFSFIQNPDTIETIARRFLENFRYPKFEFEVEVDTNLVKDNDIFDRVFIEFPQSIRPPLGQRYDIYNRARFGETKFPEEIGPIQIRDNRFYKIVGRKENIKSLTTTLSLRELGIASDDSYV